MRGPSHRFRVRQHDAPESRHEDNFEVGSHTVVIWKAMDGWVVNVEGTEIERGHFESEADAWTAGVTEAMQLMDAEGPPSSPAPPGSVPGDK